MEWAVTGRIRTANSATIIQGAKYHLPLYSFLCIMQTIALA